MWNKKLLLYQTICALLLMIYIILYKGNIIVQCIVFILEYMKIFISEVLMWKIIKKVEKEKVRTQRNFLKIFILCDSLSSLMIKLNTNWNIDTAFCEVVTRWKWTQDRSNQTITLLVVWLWSLINVKWKIYWESGSWWQQWSPLATSSRGWTTLLRILRPMI